MDIQNLQVLPLHKHPEYLQACCDLINEEWPRGETARMLSLRASCDKLPTSLILVNEKQILGHCKLTPIPSIPESCFVETVVISKSMRGKKLGTFLMKYIEDYCRNKIKLKMIHLSTKGQEGFYSKLGYTVCAPVSIYGIGIPSQITTSFPNNKVEKSETKVENNVSNGPPPPPMPKITNPVNTNIKTTKTYMFKYL